METVLTIGAKYNTIKGNRMFFGFNLYAVNGGYASLVETYETEQEAEVARHGISQKINAGYGLIIL